MKNKQVTTSEIHKPQGMILLDSLFVRLSDLLMLMKFRLLLLVVFSACMTYLIVSAGHVNLKILMYLISGGFFVAGSANTLNQIFEKDYDKLMTRTMNRPLAAGRMTVQQAIIFAGITAIVGSALLWMINPIVAVMGALSLFSYAFIYTPLKRVSSFSVLIGAIPGALPVLIGGLSYEDYDILFVLLLFAIQFFWQFPHFWAIAWKGDEQYKNAGFSLLPSASGNKDLSVGRISFIYSLILLPILAVLNYKFPINLGILSICILVTVMYIYRSYRLWTDCSDGAALKLMYTSFLYLPVMLISLLINYMFL